MHGHWTIDVRNTDGTLVTHREFENGLTSDGKQVLAEVLSRHTKFGFWRIVLGSSPSKAGLSPWSNGSTGQIVEPNDPLPLAPNVSKNLYLCLGSSQGSIGIGNLCTGVQQPAATFLLGGNIKADSSGTISGVGTTYSGCDYPATCPNPNQVGFDSFTTHQLAPLVNGSCPPNTQCEVDVVAGQIIQVTVLISFS